MTVLDYLLKYFPTMKCIRFVNVNCNVARTYCSFDICNLDTLLKPPILKYALVGSIPVGDKVGLIGVLGL